MRRMKSNIVLAAAIGVCAILCSIGYVQGREDKSAYAAPDLLLTQGQAEYDLCEGIKYNGKKYELSVSNEGAFDINTPGNYTVEYLLTPLDEEPERETPAGNGGIGPGGQAPAESSAPAETSAPAESSAPAQSQAPAESSAPAETQAPAESSAPAETQAPAESSAPAETQAPAESSAPAQSQAPAESSAPAQSQAPAESSAPAQSQAPSESNAPAESQAPAATDAPASQAPEADAPASQSPAEAGAPAEAAPEDTSTSEGAAAAQETAVRVAKEKFFLMEKAPALKSTFAFQESAAPEGTQETVKTPEHTAAPAPEETSAQETPAQETSAPQGTTEHVSQTDPAKASSSEADSALDPISFTRTVVVKAAVQYQDARYDVDTISDPLTDMDYDSDHYELTVLDDDGFNGSRIDEYHITYRLTNTDNGKMVADLERYVWITASGVEFDAPELSLRLNQTSYDLQEGIDYDAGAYTLTTVDPDSVDTSVEGEQRAMFRLTPRTEGEDIPEATPAQAVSAGSEATLAQAVSAEPEEYPAPITASESEAASAPEGPEESTASPSSAEEQPDTAVNIEGVPVAAIFGRDVKVENGPVVVIDAPPLVVMQGNEAGQDLLEGVTAKDESGNTVALQVFDRAEIDAAAGITAPAQEEANGNTAPSQEKPIGNATLSQEELISMFSMFSLRSAFPGETAGEPEDIPEAEYEFLPAGLPAGEYEVTLSSVHPVTGEVFTAERAVSVRAEGVNVLTGGSPIINVSIDKRPIQIKGNVNLTLQGTGTIAYDDTLTNAIAVMSGFNCNLTLAPGADITVTGKPGETGKTGKDVHAAGGGAGIRVEQGAKLTVIGTGRLTAYGGNAGAGGKAGGLYAGGGGGGGAGAAIGGNGGDGGDGGYRGRLPGGDAPAIPAVGSITILAPNVSLQNGLGDDSTPLTRIENSASGGGGMPAGSMWVSWDKREEYSGGSGGGGGGAASKFGGMEQGGFGQGYGRNSYDRSNYVGMALYGGFIYPASQISLTAEGSPGQLKYKTFEEAFKQIGADAKSNVRGARSKYIVTLLVDYNFTAADQAALTGLSGLTPDITIELRGARSAAQFWCSNISLPQGSAGEKGASFSIHDVKLSNCQTIAANGSKLTLGTGITTSITTPDIVGGTYETVGSVADLTTIGNTWLEVLSGNYNDIIGGNWRYWNALSISSSNTIVGNTTVHIGGTAKAARVYGGSYTKLGPSNNVPTAFRQTGNRTVTLSDTAAVANNLYAGSGCSSPQLLKEDSISEGNIALVKLEGGNPATVQATSATYNGLLKQGRVELQVTGSPSMKNVYDFEAVRLSQNSALTITGTLGRRASFGAAAKPAMLLDFQGGASLTLKSPACTAGSFKVAGGGNMLTLPRTGSDSAPLTLDGSQPTERVDDAQLGLRYPANTAAMPGDKLLFFDPTKQNAAAFDYAPQLNDYELLASKTTGYVYLATPVTWAAADGTLHYCESLKAAMAAIGNQSGSFTITIRQEGYKLTEADGIALASWGANASITFTSKFQLTPDDALRPGEAVGDWVTRTVLVGAGTTPDSPKSDVSLNAQSAVIRDIRLRYMQEGCSLYANGHKLTAGPSVQILSDNNYFPVIYGGAKNTTVDSAQLILTSGNYSGIYGGGREAGAAVTGNTSVTFGGNAWLNGSIYGGGREGAVGGDVSLDITGGQVSEASGSNMVVGGGEIGNVTGDVTVNLGDVSLPALYGAAPRQGAATAGLVGGNIKITVTGRKNCGAIGGGRSGLATPGASGQTSAITFQGGSHRVRDLMDFDVLNLGVPGTGGGSGAPADLTTLFLTGNLQGKDGDLRFWGGSVLTLQGTSADPADLVVNNIQTDASTNRSHLHMYKGPAAASGPAVSRPLYIQGDNLSASNNKLVLGEYGPGTTQEGSQVGEYGDKLLQFVQTANANPKQYVSDIQGLDIVLDSNEAGAVKLGIASAVKISLTGVSHTSAPGVTTQADRPGVTVEKTLTFQINSIAPHEPGTPAPPGADIQSAYVSKSSLADPAWEDKGTIPADGTEIQIHNTATPGKWTGTVTMDITPPIEPSPEYYFAHVRDINKQTTVIVLDVHSPSEDGTPEISRDGMGNYTFTVKLWDKKPVIPGDVDPDIIYNVSGLQQLGWAVGNTTDPHPAGETEALAPQMVERDKLKGVTKLPTPSIESFVYTFTVPAGDLVPDPGSKTVYLYAKDAIGNTAVYPIPLNENLMDIQIPLWAGTIALRGGDDPQLIAPNMYVTNWGEKPVMAELVGADISPDQGTEQGKLLLTGKSSGPWAPNELNLMVKPVEDGLGSGSFPITSVTELNSGARTVDLGTMPGRDQPNHGTSYTFEALYDPDTILLTSGWSQCALTYRFSLNPVPEPVPTPASTVDLEPARITNQTPGQEPAPASKLTLSQ